MERFVVAPFIEKLDARRYIMHMPTKLRCCTVRHIWDKER